MQIFSPGWFLACVLLTAFSTEQSFLILIIQETNRTSSSNNRHFGRVHLGFTSRKAQALFGSLRSESGQGSESGQRTTQTDNVRNRRAGQTEKTLKHCHQACPQSPAAVISQSSDCQTMTSYNDPTHHLREAARKGCKCVLLNDHAVT